VPRRRPSVPGKIISFPDVVLLYAMCADGPCNITSNLPLPTQFEIWSFRTDPKSDIWIWNRGFFWQRHPFNKRSPRGGIPILVNNPYQTWPWPHLVLTASRVRANPSLSQIDGLGDGCQVQGEKKNRYLNTVIYSTSPIAGSSVGDGPLAVTKD